MHGSETCCGELAELTDDDICQIAAAGDQDMVVELPEVIQQCMTRWVETCLSDCYNRLAWLTTEASPTNRLATV